MKCTIFWFRRDLRLHDNAGLYHALKNEENILPIFIFDKNILDDLTSKDDARVSFIYSTIEEMKTTLQKEYNSDLLIFHDTPKEAFEKLVKDYDVESVYTNRDYEPYAKERDSEIEEFLSENDISFNSFKDHVIFEKDEVLKDDGDPYVVFTPYKKIWMEKLNSRGVGDDSYYVKSYPTLSYSDSFAKMKPSEILDIGEMGFKLNESISIPDKTVKRSVIKNYKQNRDYPAKNGTSKLGIHYRFGTISIREKCRRAWELSETYVNELVWRDFYSKILDAFPKVVDTSFREKYDKIIWRNNKEEFEAWKQGQTGYPMVDAGMRQLNEIGYMHNRVRMVVASFLTKHLLIDWRWGEAYFAEKLLDYELASNNGGWQWAAGTGTDAAPYFRIFNPSSQLNKFDKEKKYVKEWIPELESDKYPDPIVDHKEARQRALDEYKKALA